MVLIVCEQITKNEILSYKLLKSFHLFLSADKLCDNNIVAFFIDSGRSTDNPSVQLNEHFHQFEILGKETEWL